VIAAAVRGRGPASVQFDYQISRADDGARLVSGFTVHACVNAGGRPVRIPAALRRAVGVEQAGGAKRAGGREGGALPGVPARARAVADGASELDLVANLAWIRAGDDDAVRAEVAAVVAAGGGAAVKVILETALFPDQRKVAAARAAVAGGAAFVKTSTGFGGG